MEKQLKDAKFGIERGILIELPKMKLSFSKDLSSGVLKLKNSLKFDRKLDDVEMSAALGKYIVEKHYTSDDGNWYIYELIDGSISYKLTFTSADNFSQYNKQLGDYELFLDGRTSVKLQHTLLVGQTGSGKTYTLYNLILQMLNKSKAYKLFFADPKASSLAVIGQRIAPELTASDIDSIIDLLEEFVSLMRARKAEMQTLLEQKLDADYSDFGLSPSVFIFDEYASFASVLQSRDKATRDKVKALIYEVILQGRQLGFFMLITMQKSDASLIDTALRDNLSLKIVLGNAEPQTYVTAFGNGVDIPDRNYAVGEGVFTEPKISPKPKRVQFPFCDFDILQALCRTPVL